MNKDDLSYFLKINNLYKSASKQDTALYELNEHVDKHFADNIDYKLVKRNGEPFEILIIRDTDGNTFKKKIKAKHSTPFNLGDYIEWNGQYWLVTLIDPDDKTYHSGYMYLCTVPLRWQTLDGAIIERWAYSEDFTKYSSGVLGNNVLQVGDNQYGLTLPIDNETKKLKRDMRFPIDLEDVEIPDIYELTNRKVNLNNDIYFGRGGIMTLTVSYNAFSKETDKLVTLDDGTQVWIADYHSPTVTPTPPDETTDLSASIVGVDTLKIGFAKIYKAEFKDLSGNVLNNIDFEWNVISDFEVIKTINTNGISLRVDDEDYIDSSFLLQIIKDNTVISEKIITVSYIF